MKWPRPSNPWARLAGAVAMTGVFGVALMLPGWVCAHVSDAIDVIRAALS